MDISKTTNGIDKMATATFEAGRAFGKTATAFRMLSGRPLRMSRAPASYTISAYGVVTRCAPWANVAKFVPPYVPAKASRVFPALKTCTSPRRALRRCSGAYLVQRVNTLLDSI